MTKMRDSLLIGALVLLAGCNIEPRDDGRPRQVAKDQSGDTFTFGSIDTVPGTRFVTIPIQLGDRQEGSSYSGSSAPERNRIILDTSTGSHRRVLPDETAELVNWVELGSSASASEYSVAEMNEPAAGSAKTITEVYAAVVKRRHDSDESAATYDVLVGRFEDGKQEWVAKALDGVDLWQTPENRIAMVAVDAGRTVFRLYDPVTFRQLIETELKLTR